MSDTHGHPTAPAPGAPVHPTAQAPGAHVPDEHGSSHEVVGPHGSTTDHGEGHGHDDHAHLAEPLGPIDWPMWGVGILGVVAGLVVAVFMALATDFVLIA